MTDTPEVSHLDPRDDLWRWSARELAAETEFVVVAAMARRYRHELEWTVSSEDDFRDLAVAYRRLEGEEFARRTERFRARLVRLLEHRLENRDIDGFEWATEFAGLGSTKRKARADRSDDEEAMDDAERPDPVAAFLATLSDEQREEIERSAIWHEFVDPEQGLLITSPTVGEPRAILLLRKVRRLIEKGVLKLTDRPPRPDYFDEATGLSMADPRLPEERAIARLLEVRAEQAVIHTRRQAEIDRTPTFNTFAHMGWPREPIDDDLTEEFGPTPPEAQAPDWRAVPELPVLDDELLDPPAELRPALAPPEPVTPPPPRNQLPVQARRRRHTRPADPPKP